MPTFIWLINLSFILLCCAANTYMPMNSTDIQLPGTINNTIFPICHVVSFILVGSTPISWEIVTILASIGVCFTIITVGVVLVITLKLKCKAKKKRQKPKAKELSIREQTPIDNFSEM